MGGKKFRNGVKSSPPSLQLIALRSTLALLERSCKEPKNVASTAELRRECRLSIPCSLRQRLLEELLKSGRLYNTLQLYVFDALLCDDITRLSVRHVRRWYRNHFVDVMSSGRAAGLQVLLFEDITWLTGNPVMSVPLAAMLGTLTNLLQVSLRFVCDDVLLDSLGRSCLRLEEVDASGSMGVTDVGLQRLCIKGYANLSQVAQAKARDKGVWSAVKRRLRRCFFDCFLETALDVETALPNWWRSSVIRRARKNACCDTLKVVHLTSTRVTDVGVELLKSSVPAVKVVCSTLGKLGPR